MKKSKRSILYYIFIAGLYIWGIFEIEFRCLMINKMQYTLLSPYISIPMTACVVIGLHYCLLGILVKKHGINLKFMAFLKYYDIFMLAIAASIWLPSLFSIYSLNELKKILLIIFVQLLIIISRLLISKIWSKKTD